MATETNTKTMRAVTQPAYGTPEVLEIKDIPVPTLEPHQILIEVHSSSVNAAEWHLTTGLPLLVRPTMGFRAPKKMVVGADVAGVVKAVGPEVSDLAPGDRVFGDVGGGTWAEYARGTEKTLALLPDQVSFEQAGAIGIAGLTALQGLVDHGGLKEGEDVLIIGASGGVGTYAVQIAKALGANVTAVCSTRNVDQTRELGADRVVDYKVESYTDLDERFDLILDNVGMGPVLKTKSLLKKGGRYVFVSGPKRRLLGPIPKMLRSKIAYLVGDKTMNFFVAESNREDLETLGRFLASGQVRSVIENRYDLDSAADALAYLGEGHSRGKNVINVISAA